MIFKNKYSPDSIFTFAGETRQCINWKYETKDKDEIKFLKANVNFNEFKAEKVEPKDDIIVEVEKTEEDNTAIIVEDNDQKTRDFIVKNWGK